MNNNRPSEAITITCPGKNAVYGITDLKEVKYIGQTDQGVEQRIAKGYPNNPEVDKLLSGPHEVIIFHEGISDRHADARERLYIAKYQTMINVGGYNHQTGGKRGYTVLRRDSQPIIGTHMETGKEVSFPSVAWACEVTGARANHIYENMRGTRKSVAGYCWKPASPTEEGQ